MGLEMDSDLEMGMVMEMDWGLEMDSVTHLDSEMNLSYLMVREKEITITMGLGTLRVSVRCKHPSHY